MKILVLDNYDSFTYNLVQYLQEITGKTLAVFRNDAISLDAVAAYDTIILSPGPGVPADAGIMPELIKHYASTKSIFGVCLGLQAIGEAFGGELINLEKVFHGIATNIEVIDPTELLFADMPSNFTAGRYHSWVVSREQVPAELKITAVATDQSIMAMAHREYHVKGVQFHPESIMTEYGHKILENFLSEAAQRQKASITPKTINS